MAKAGETVTHLLLAGETFTISTNMGVTSVSIEGTSAESVTVTGASTLSTPTLLVGNGAVPINEDSSPVTIAAKEAELLDGITIASPSTGTASIIIQK